MDSGPRGDNVHSVHVSYASSGKTIGEHVLHDVRPSQETSNDSTLTRTTRMTDNNISRGDDVLPFANQVKSNLSIVYKIVMALILCI